MEFPCYDPPSAYNQIHIPPVSQSYLDAMCETYVLMTWGSGDTYSTNDDYDLWILDGDENVVVSSMIQQDSSFPHGMEMCRFSPQAGKTYAVAIYRFQGTSSREITLELYDECLEYLDCHNPEKTILSATPAENLNAITVGAVSWSSPDRIERISGQGPTAHGIAKPDLVAPTNVTTSDPGYECGATSCATPHVAGVCALVKQAYPSWSPGQIKSSLESNAIDLGPAGKDNTYGSGRVSLAGIALPGVLTPMVSTGTASSVTETSATLNGTVNPNGVSTTYYFEYGTTTSYGSRTSEMNAGSGDSAVSVSADIAGLTEETTYHFRLVATNTNGTTYGSDGTFGGAGGGSDGGGGGGGCFIGTGAKSCRWH